MNTFYYDDKGRTFPTHYEAIKHNAQYYYFYDKEFIEVDWTKEPQESLPELYKRRAEQLRETYDYLVLAYSGGFDSTNVLETFHYNNIKLDEILTVGAYSQDSNNIDSDENHNADLYLNAFPTLKKLAPKSKITNLDYTKWFDNPQQFSYIKNYGSDWYKHFTVFYSVHHLFWRDIKLFLKIPQDKKVGIILGMEKPFYGYDWKTDKGFISFNNAMEAYGPDYINFYTDPEFPDIHRKQIHLIHKWFVQFVVLDKQLAPGIFYKKYHKIIPKLIYDYKNPLVFASDKSPTNILSARDHFMKKAQNTEIYNLYVDMVHKLSLDLPSEIVLASQKDRIRSFNSRRYYLS